MKYLIFGAKGQLGSEFVEIFTKNNTTFEAFDIDECDIRNEIEVMSCVQSFKPDIILNCSAYNLVDDAEKDNTEAFQINMKGTCNIARAAYEAKSYLVHYSTDYVFDGAKGDFYIEADKVNPLNEYGKSKLHGEYSIADIFDNFVIFRLSWVYGKGTQNFIYKFMQWAESKNELNITFDEYSIPTYTGIIAEKTLISIKNYLKGIYHLASSGNASRFEWAEEIKKNKNLNVKLNPVEIKTFNLPAKRPINSSLSNKEISRICGEIPHWKEDLKKFLNK